MGRSLAQLLISQLQITYQMVCCMTLILNSPNTFCPLWMQQVCVCW